MDPLVIDNVDISLPDLPVTTIKLRVMWGTGACREMMTALSHDEGPALSPACFTKLLQLMELHDSLYPQFAPRDWGG